MTVEELIELLKLLPKDTCVFADNPDRDMCSGLWITYKESWPQHVRFSSKNPDTLKVKNYVSISGFTPDKDRYPKGVHLSQSIRFLQEDNAKENAHNHVEDCETAKWKYVIRGECPRYADRCLVAIDNSNYTVCIYDSTSGTFVGRDKSFKRDCVLKWIRINEIPNNRNEEAKHGQS